MDYGYCPCCGKKKVRPYCDAWPACGLYRKLPPKPEKRLGYFEELFNGICFIAGCIGFVYLLHSIDVFNVVVKNLVK